MDITDASRISRAAMSHFAQTEAMLPFQHFRIHSIKPNSKPDYWVVICSFDERFGSDKRRKFELHISKEGKVGEHQEID